MPCAPRARHPPSCSTSTPWSTCAAVAGSARPARCSARRCRSSRSSGCATGTSCPLERVRTSTRAIARLEDLAVEAATVAARAASTASTSPCTTSTRRSGPSGWPSGCARGWGRSARCGSSSSGPSSGRTSGRGRSPSPWCPGWCRGRGALTDGLCSSSRSPSWRSSASSSGRSTRRRSWPGRSDTTCARPGRATRARRTPGGCSGASGECSCSCSTSRKAYLPTLLVLRTMGTVPALVAGLAVVLGHVFSPFLRGRGGKGVACALGAVLAVEPFVGLGAVVVFALAKTVLPFVGEASVVTMGVVGLVGVLGLVGLAPFVGPVVGVWLVLLSRARAVAPPAQHRRLVVAAACRDGRRWPRACPQATRDGRCPRLRGTRRPSLRRPRRPQSGPGYAVLHSGRGASGRAARPFLSVGVCRDVTPPSSSRPGPWLGSVRRGATCRPLRRGLHRDPRVSAARRATAAAPAGHAMHGLSRWGWVRVPVALEGARWQPGRSAVLGCRRRDAAGGRGVRAPGGLGHLRRREGGVMAPGGGSRAGPTGVTAGAAPVGVTADATARGIVGTRGEETSGAGMVTRGGAPTVTGTPGAAVVVHVVGQVRRPGVLRLAAGSRVADALDAAGGPTPRPTSLG